MPHSKVNPWMMFHCWSWIVLSTWFFSSISFWISTPLMYTRVRDGKSQCRSLQCFACLSRRVWRGDLRSQTYSEDVFEKLVRDRSPRLFAVRRVQRISRSWRSNSTRSPSDSRTQQRLVVLSDWYLSALWKYILCIESPSLVTPGPCLSQTRQLFGIWCRCSFITYLCFCTCRSLVSERKPSDETCFFLSVLRNQPTTKNIL